MTSITQLLQPAPYTFTKHSVVLHEHSPYPPNPAPNRHILSNMQQPAPSPPSDPSAQDHGAISNESDGGENGGDGRKGYGKRELSTSKRAAQNRAAQRAFRQRKEGYIKKLEEQVRDYQALNESFKQVQTENYQLRDYIISLQSRLLESQGEIPPPPVDGLQPGKAMPSSQSGSLPRLSELNNNAPQSDNLPGLQEYARQGPEANYFEQPAVKRPRTGSTELTPPQSALQGPSVMNRSPSSAR